MILFAMIHYQMFVKTDTGKYIIPPKFCLERMSLSHMQSFLRDLEQFWRIFLFLSQQ